MWCIAHYMKPIAELQSVTCRMGSQRCNLSSQPWFSITAR